MSLSSILWFRKVGSIEAARNLAATLLDQFGNANILAPWWRRLSREERKTSLSNNNVIHHVSFDGTDDTEDSDGDEPAMSLSAIRLLRIARRHNRRIRLGLHEVHAKVMEMHNGAATLLDHLKIDRGG